MEQKSGFVSNEENYVFKSLLISDCFSDVEDITDVLEITVLDENRHTKADFLGKVIFYYFSFFTTLNSLLCPFLGSYSLIASS